MFGYVRVNSPELKVKEYEFYRGTYCGLCRSMGKCTGQCSRLTLSYDFAFLALVRLALHPESVTFEQKRCLAHPLKKRNTMHSNSALTYCAGAAALLNYHKIVDDITDEMGWKRFRAQLAYPFTAHSRKKAIRSGLAELDAQIASGLKALAQTESSHIASVDVPAVLFGHILGDIMAFGLEGTSARIAQSLGQTVGKWIYIADALDDWQEDAEKKRYNPFLLLYGSALPSQEERMRLCDALKNELYEAEVVVDLIEFEDPDIKHIILNILYLGMPERIRAICSEPNDKKRNMPSKKQQKGRITNERSL